MRHYAGFSQIRSQILLGQCLTDKKQTYTIMFMAMMQHQKRISLFDENSHECHECLCLYTDTTLYNISVH